MQFPCLCNVTYFLHQIEDVADTVDSVLLPTPPRDNLGEVVCHCIIVAGIIAHQSQPLKHQTIRWTSSVRQTRCTFSCLDHHHRARRKNFLLLIPLRLLRATPPTGPFSIPPTLSGVRQHVWTPPQKKSAGDLTQGHTSSGAKATIPRLIP